MSGWLNNWGKAGPRPIGPGVAFMPEGHDKGLVMKELVSAYQLRLPTSLKAAVTEISKAVGMSINQFAIGRAGEKVSGTKTASKANTMFRVGSIFTILLLNTFRGHI